MNLNFWRKLKKRKKSSFKQLHDFELRLLREALKRDRKRRVDYVR
jgi:hypothetical protein